MNSEALPGNRARAIIAERWPTIARGLDATAPFTELVLDTSGPVQTIAAAGIRLASAWEPDAEAALQCARLPDRCNGITLYGVGMAYLPALLLKRLAPGGTLHVIIMNASLFDTLLDVIEQSDWLAHPAVDLSLAGEHEKPCVTTSDNPVITTPLLALAEPSAMRLRDQLWQMLSQERVAGFQATLESMILDNLQANEPSAAVDADVAELFRQHPAAAGDGNTGVIVGAGPSLDYALPRISELQGAGARIVAVDAALIPLLQAGVVPDIIVSLDPKPEVLQFYDVDLAPLSHCALVYFPSIDPGVVQHWPWQRYVAYTTHSRFDALRERLPRASLFASGSVIHPAADVAVRLGCSRLFLAGADFCFPFDSTHADAVVFNRSAREFLDTGHTVTDYCGNAVATRMNFISYFRDLEAYISSPLCCGRRFINLGTYSARIQGVHAEPIDDDAQQVGMTRQAGHGQVTVGHTASKTAGSNAAWN